MNIISLFSGCGGLDLGFERAGFHISVANEFDKTIWATYKENHPYTHLIEGDVRQITKADISEYIDGEVDGIIGGYDVAFSLVNAKDYGVAEERKRVFYIGFRKDLGIDFGFPKGSTKDDDKKITLRDIIWDLQETDDRVSYWY